MSELASASRVDWFGTFGAILVPGAVVGALLAIAWARGAAGATRGMGWFALAPLAFVVGTIVQPEVLENLLSGGFGLGEIAFTAFVVAGGFGIGGGRPRWARWTCAVIGAAFLVALVASLSVAGGPRFALTEPRGAWLAVLAGSLGALIMIAEAIPFRYASRARDAAGALGGSVTMLRRCSETQLPRS